MDTAAFIVCLVKDDQVFFDCLNALIRAGFNVNKENEDDESFLQRLCLSAKVSNKRIRCLLQHNPKISETDIQNLSAKVAISKQRSNKSTKQAIK